MKCLSRVVLAGGGAIEPVTSQVHDGVILDDLRDLRFLTDHQDAIQGKYDTPVEFASTQGGTCAFKKYLFATPIVATANYSTANLGFLETHDWLGNRDNRVVIHLAPDWFNRSAGAGPAV